MAISLQRLKLGRGPIVSIFRLITLFSVLAASGCADRPTTAATRAEVYGRADRAFGPGRLWKPVDDPGLLAPLIVAEEDADGAAPGGAAEVTVREGTVDAGGVEWQQWQYEWGAPGSAGVRGLRISVGPDGFPAVYEILGDSSGLRPLFVGRELEEAAVARFGSPLPGRSFAIERPVKEAPDVVVLGVVEPGPTPLGPFVYQAAASLDLQALHCRCAPTLTDTFTASLEYRLTPAPPTPSPPLATLLRLP